jgi:hypothetical protein
MNPLFTEEAVYRSVELMDLEIDSEGRIWRLASRRLVCPLPLRVQKRRAENRTGKREYLQVRVMIAGTRVHAMAHRLVWRHFFGPIPNGMVINHRNGIKTDNRPENLELTTPSGNTQHAVSVLRSHPGANQDGQKNPMSKIPDEDIQRIRDRYASGNVTQTDLAQEYGITFQHVSAIVRGKTRKASPGPVGDYSSRRNHNNLVRDPVTGRYVAASL